MESLTTFDLQIIISALEKHLEKIKTQELPSQLMLKRTEQLIEDFNTIITIRNNKLTN